MIEVKVNSTTKVPIKLVDAIDYCTPETGVSSPTVYFVNAGYTAAQPLGSPTWAELSATYMPGCYNLTLTAAMTDTAGPLLIDVTATGCAHSTLLINVVDRFASDTYSEALRARQHLQNKTQETGVAPDATLTLRNDTDTANLGSFAWDDDQKTRTWTES